MQETHKFTELKLYTRTSIYYVKKRNYKPKYLPMVLNKGRKHSSLTPQPNPNLHPHSKDSQPRITPKSNPKIREKVRERENTMEIEKRKIQDEEIFCLSSCLCSVTLKRIPKPKDAIKAVDYKAQKQS